MRPNGKHCQLTKKTSNTHWLSWLAGNWSARFTQLHQGGLCCEIRPLDLAGAPSAPQGPTAAYPGCRFNSHWPVSGLWPASQGHHREGWQRLPSVQSGQHTSCSRGIAHTRPSCCPLLAAPINPIDIGLLFASSTSGIGKCSGALAAVRRASSHDAPNSRKVPERHGGPCDARCQRGCRLDYCLEPRWKLKSSIASWLPAWAESGRSEQVSLLKSISAQSTSSTRRRLRSNRIFPMLPWKLMLGWRPNARTLSGRPCLVLQGVPSFWDCNKKRDCNKSQLQLRTKRLTAQLQRP